jgi:hypothetical protein
MTPLDAYLTLPSSPAPGSPVAHTMKLLLEREPGLDLAVCRERASELLADAAKRRQYAVRYPAFERQAAA